MLQLLTFVTVVLVVLVTIAYLAAIAWALIDTRHSMAAMAAGLEAAQRITAILTRTLGRQHTLIARPDAAATGA
jgi:hypothetical protein